MLAGHEARAVAEHRGVGEARARVEVAASGRVGDGVTVAEVGRHGGRGDLEDQRREAAPEVADEDALNERAGREGGRGRGGERAVARGDEPGCEERRGEEGAGEGAEHGDLDGWGSVARLAMGRRRASVGGGRGEARRVGGTRAPMVMGVTRRRRE